MKKLFLVLLSMFLITGCNTTAKEPVNNDANSNVSGETKETNPSTDDEFNPTASYNLFDVKKQITVNGSSYTLRYVATGYEYAELDGVVAKLQVLLNDKVVLNEIGVGGCSKSDCTSEITSDIVASVVHNNIMLAFNLDEVGSMNLDKAPSWLYVFDVKGNVLISEPDAAAYFIENGENVAYLVVGENSITINDAATGIRKYTYKSGTYTKEKLSKPSTWERCCGL